MIVDKLTWLFIIAVISLVTVPTLNSTLLYSLQKQGVDLSEKIIAVVDDNNKQLNKSSEQHNQISIIARQEQNQIQQQIIHDNSVIHGMLVNLTKNKICNSI